MKRNLLFSLALGATLMAQAQAVPNFEMLDMNLETRGDKSFPESFTMGNAILVDYNNDGWLDVAMKGRGYWTDSETGFLKNNQGQFVIDKTAEAAFPINDYHGAFRAIDFNNDGNVDLVMAAEGSWRLWKNNGDGTFQLVEGFSEAHANLAKTSSETLYGNIFAVADMNNDGNADIVTFLAENGDEGISRNLVVLEGDGQGNFTQRVINETARGGNSSLAIGDINADGLKDIAICGWGSNGTVVLVAMQLADGTFVATEQPITGCEKAYVNLVDLNSDGLPDLVFSGESYDGSEWGKNLNVSLNSGDATFPFDLATRVLNNGSRSGNDWADMNGDGTVDILLGCDDYAEVGIFVNDGKGALRKTRGYMSEGSRGCPALATGDLNHDGYLDVLAMGYADSGKMFKIWQNVGDGQRGITKSEAPAVPQNVKAEDTAEGVKLTWEKAEGALLYNYYLRTADGRLLSAIPADPATGFVRQADLNAGLTTNSIVLRGLKSEQIAELGVQSISAGKVASAFGLLTTGVERIQAQQGQTTYFDLSGRQLAKPAKGVSIQRQGDKAVKVMR